MIFCEHHHSQATLPLASARKRREADWPPGNRQGEHYVV